MPAHRQGPVEPVEYSTDIQEKRARGEISCAECRRLRLKCDRKVPCSTCARRGCGSICPNGLLKSDARKRHESTTPMLADLEQLHAKIAEMSRRIRTLEDALQLLQEQLYPGTAHRLLQPHLRLIKSIVEPPSKPTHSQAEGSTARPAVQEEELADAFGSLAVAPDGAPQYFGRSADTEIIFMRASENVQSATPNVGPIRTLSDAFPFRKDIGLPLDDTLSLLESHLPAQDRAWSLCETYLETTSSYFRPFTREDLFEFVFNPIFCPAQGFGTPPSQIHAHRLGLLFAVLAVGSLSDMSLPPRNAEAENYFQLGKAAMSMRPILEQPSFESVVAMGFMTVYLIMSEQARTMTPIHLRVTCLLAQNLGLHRDPGRWGLPARVVDMRRRVFWEINTLDQMQCTITTYPPFFCPKIVDCEAPTDKDRTSNPDGSTRMGHWAWKIHCFQAMLETLNELTTRAKLPSHEKVMSLDAKIRADLIPTSLRPFINREIPDDGSPTVYMQRLRFRLAESVALIFLHRTYFAQCIRDHPTYPERSSYSASYMAAYEAGVNVLKIFKEAADERLNLLVRFPYQWSFGYSAAVLVGTAIARGINQPFATAGLIALANIIGVYKRGAETLNRARVALPYLSALLGKAQDAYEEHWGRNVRVTESDESPVLGGQISDSFRFGTSQPTLGFDIPPDRSQTHHFFSGSFSSAGVSNSFPEVEQAAFPRHYGTELNAGSFDSLQAAGGVHGHSNGSYFSENAENTFDAEVGLGYGTSSESFWDGGSVRTPDEPAQLLGFPIPQTDVAWDAFMSNMGLFSSADSSSPPGFK